MTCLCGAPSDAINCQIWKFKICPKGPDQRTNKALENVLKLVLNSLGFLQHVYIPEVEVYGDFLLLAISYAMTSTPHVPECANHLSAFVHNDRLQSTFLDYRATPRETDDILRL